MKRFFETLRNIWKIEELKQRILTTLGLILIYRLGSYVVLPGINTEVLTAANANSNDGGIIALINAFLGSMGAIFGYPTFSLDTVLGFLFAGLAWAMGVPSHEIMTAGALMGTKLVANEFVAYLQLKDMITKIDPKTMVVVSFALCGFANFGSVGIQIGGISALEPERRADLARLGFRALIAGTLASYMSGTLAGLLL